MGAGSGRASGDWFRSEDDGSGAVPATSDFDTRPRLPPQGGWPVDFSDQEIAAPAVGGDGCDDQVRGPGVAHEPMFHVKVCGVTSADDARMVAAAGADAIGLNFVPGSPRCLDAAAARRVAEAVPDDVLVVGVFAGATPEEMRRVAAEVGLDAIQLHGRLGGEASDPPEACAAVAPLPVIRAVRLAADGFGEVRGWLAEAATLGHAPVMAVVDAAVPTTATPGALGGTGETVDWSRLTAAGSLGIPIALAGGLTPDNVAAAIAATRVRAVDTASGVEQAPGRKDPEKVRRFCEAARMALARAGL